LLNSADYPIEAEAGTIAGYIALSHTDAGLQLFQSGVDRRSLGKKLVDWWWKKMEIAKSDSDSSSE
jgi:hypothetical protein